MLAKLNSYGLSLGSLSTKGAHEVSGSDIRFLMKRTELRMMPLQDVRLGNLPQHCLWNPPGQYILLVVDRSDLGLEGPMAKVCRGDSQTEKR